MIIISYMSQPQSSRRSAPSPSTAQPADADARQFDSHALLRGERELLINHNGELYRLRLTRSGKLILTK